MFDRHRPLGHAVSSMTDHQAIPLLLHRNQIVRLAGKLARGYDNRVGPQQHGSRHYGPHRGGKINGLHGFPPGGLMYRPGVIHEIPCRSRNVIRREPVPAFPVVVSLRHKRLSSSLNCASARFAATTCEASRLVGLARLWPRKSDNTGTAAGRSAGL